MSKAVTILIIVCLIPIHLFGQLKDQHNIDFKNHIIKPDNSFLGLGFIDLDKIKMSHSYELSYLSAGNIGVSESLYLNTISYQIADPLSLKLQWGMQHFPYTSFGDNPAFKGGLVFSGMELKYKPSENLMFKFEYNALPRTGYYNRYNNYFWKDEE